MPRLPNYIEKKIFAIPHHVAELPEEAGVPILHFKRSANDSWNLHLYIERNLARTNTYATAEKKHFARLNRMVILSLCASFERFLKELAAVCIDHLNSRTTDADDRFDEFNVSGSALAAHFDAKTAGSALCESSTWLNCDQVNKRFRGILRDVDGEPADVYIFPKKANQQPTSEQWRYPVMSALWQLRHSIAHNDGVVTQSDALTLKLLIRSQLAGGKILCPTKQDIIYVKRFLDKAAESINSRVAKRLSDLLTTIHDADNSIFDPAVAAKRLAEAVGVAVTVSGQTAHP
jgi:hypothetical protein